MRTLTRNRLPRSFTMVEVLVVISIIVVLVGVIIVASSAVVTKNKAARTTQVMDVVCSAVEAFKQSQGYYPLAVPDDAWGTNWNTGAYTARMKWNTRWTEYFVSDGAPNPNPDFSWPSPPTNPEPTNIHMLMFQLQQVPESKSIIQQVIDRANVEFHKSFRPATGYFENEDNPCQIRHPLNSNLLTAYQLQDGWGVPLRYWSGDILKWAKEITLGNWPTDVQSLLSGRLKAANWGFFIESAGPDNRFGWYGNSGSSSSYFVANEDNIYSVE